MRLLGDKPIRTLVTGAASDFRSKGNDKRHDGQENKKGIGPI